MTNPAEAPVQHVRKARNRPVPSGEIGTPQQIPATGRWTVRVTIDGRRRRVNGKTKKECLERARALKAAPTATVEGLPTSPTVAQWLDHWRTHVLPGSVKETTRVQYDHAITAHLVPQLGHRKLAELTPAQVREMLGRLSRERGKRGRSTSDRGKPLSANTRRIVKAVLHRALRDAMRDGLVTRNAADGVTVPLESKRGRALRPEQARELLAAIDASAEPTRALLTFLINTGARKGEALGLRWGDIDLAAGTAHIQRTLSRAPSEPGKARGTSLYLSGSAKTRGSDRIVRLSEPVVTALKRWREVQRFQRGGAALAPGQKWGLGMPNDLVFTGPHGQALDPSYPNDRLSELTESLGLGHWTPHSLRHTAASLQLGAGVSLPTVSRSLGHAGIAITADLYGHLVSGEAEAASEALTAVLYGERSDVAAGE